MGVVLSTALVEYRGRVLERFERWATIWLANSARWFARRTGPRQHVLVAAPGAGNIGDRAMLESFLQNVAGPKVVLIKDPADADGAVAEYDETTAVVLGSVLYASFLGYLSGLWPVVRTLVGGASVSFIGADIMDGAYNDRASARRFYLADAVGRAGIDTRVLGFSWNANPRPRALRALRWLTADVRLYARDPASAERMRGTTAARVIDSADLAFSHQESPAAPDILGWMNEQRSMARRVALVNLNSLVERITSQVDAYRAACQHLLDSGWSIVAVPHDPRNAPSDVDLAESLSRELRSSNFRVAPHDLTPSEVRSMARVAEMTISARMHLAILSLDELVPTISISYQGKVDGLYRLLQLPDNWIEPGPGFGVRLLAAVVQCEQNLDVVRSALDSRVPVLTQLSKRNFEGLAAVSVA